MSNRLIFIPTFLLLMSLSACVRSSSEYQTRLPAQSGLSLTPTSTIGSITTSSSIPPGTAASLETITPLATHLASLSTQTSLPPAVTGTAALPPEVIQALSIMPLVTGSSWVYSDEAYSMDEKAVWRIADTVVDNLVHPPYFAAKIQREVALISGTPSASFVNPPSNSVFWYLVDRSRVYRQDGDQAAGPNWNELDNLTLEFIFPLSAKAGCWYPDPSQRQAVPSTGTTGALGAQSAPGCRQGGDGVTQKFPAGTLDRCHPVITPSNNGTEKMTYCDGVGIAEKLFDHQGTRFGEHWLLTGYLVQTP